MTADSLPTFDEYEALVRRAYAAHPNWRLGQAYVNVAHTFLPGVLAPIETERRDCFYRDDMIPGFLDRVRAGLPPATAPADPVGDAVNTLWLHRHHLPTDALRTLADAWSCASAAQHGEPYEPFWQFDEEEGFYASHDAEACEQENRGTS